jgi:pyrimidine-nucleoside phosphorylase
MDETAMRHAIERKRDGAELSGDDWHGIVRAYMDGSVDDAQMAALCMAALWRGLTLNEAHALTDAMVRSGETITFPDPVVDKHSSGGVGDIVSLVAVPLAAACGVRVAKLSGRSLGHTGGTIDKLETIAGFDAHLSVDRFVAQVERIGCAIAAQTDSLVPADKRIYSLRDRTGTVPAMGLIAASMVSKKIAGGAHAFVFDVKAGRGSFMHRVEDARELARWLTEISKSFGRSARAIVSNMDEPLGRSIGTGIEVIEARDLLAGGAADERAWRLASAVADALLAAADIIGGEQRLHGAITSGAAYAKFVEMIEAQGGSRTALEEMHLDDHPQAVEADRDGYLGAIDVVRLGNVGRMLAGEDSVAGLRVAVRIGERVRRGMPLAFIYGSPKSRVRDLTAAFEISSQAVQATQLIYDVI